MTEREVEQLTAFIDGELEASEAEAVKAKLAENAEWRAMETKLRRALKSLQTLPGPVPSAGLKTAVMSRLDDPKPSFVETLSKFFTVRRLVTAGALGVAVVLALLWNFYQGRVPATFEDVEQVYVAEHFDELEDFEVLGLQDTADLEVVEALHQLEGNP